MRTFLFVILLTVPLRADFKDVRNQLRDIGFDKDGLSITNGNCYFGSTELYLTTTGTLYDFSTPLYRGGEYGKGQTDLWQDVHAILSTFSLHQPAKIQKNVFNEFQDEFEPNVEDSLAEFEECTDRISVRLSGRTIGFSETPGVGKAPLELEHVLKEKIYQAAKTLQRVKR